MLEALFGAGVLLWMGSSIISNGKKARQEAEEEQRRKACPPCFTDGVSEDEFLRITYDAAKSLPRVKSISVDGLEVEIEVESITGITVWAATIDFNDYGHLSGWYKIESENEDSKIPEAFARKVNEVVLSRRNS